MNRESWPEKLWVLDFHDKPSVEREYVNHAAAIRAARRRGAIAAWNPAYGEFIEIEKNLEKVLGV